MSRYTVRPMRLDDIDAVSEVERECFATPWPSSAYRRELRDNRMGRYLVRSGGGAPAHAGALTLWTTRIGVDRDAFLRGLVAAIADARPQADVA